MFIFPKHAFIPGRLYLELMKCVPTHLMALPLVSFFTLFIYLYPLDLSAQGTSASIQAGVARINITPGSPIPMSGYGNRPDPYKGVHDSLYATAMVFSDGRQKAVHHRA